MLFESEINKAKQYFFKSPLNKNVKGLSPNTCFNSFDSSPNNYYSNDECHNGLLAYLNIGTENIENKINSVKPNPKKFWTAEPQNHDCLQQGEMHKNQYDCEINQDQEPQVIKKKTDMKLNYVQNIAVRYLRPPTPPNPGDIIIQEMESQVPPAAPPIIIRQRPVRCATPQPLVLREKPPVPPKIDTTRRLIKIPGKRLPPRPRCVIFERLPAFPPKPQSILIERWLPYPKTKRRVIYLKSRQPKMEKPRNLIIHWDAPKVDIKREFKCLGVIRADPKEYTSRFQDELISRANVAHFVDEIKLPDEKLLNQNQDDDCEELMGDVEALAMIDLEREGLGQYRKYLAKKVLVKDCETTKKQSKKNLPNVWFNEEQLIRLAESVFLNLTNKNSNERITYMEALKIFRRIDFNLDRRVENSDLNMFFTILDKEKRGSLGIDEFKQAFVNLWALHG